MKSNMKIRIEHFFEAAHKLPDSEDLITKKCTRLHGHTYKVMVEIKGPQKESGMVVDFKAIKNIIDQYDHQYLNELMSVPTTAENIAKELALKINEFLGSEYVAQVSVIEGYHGVDSPVVTYP
jgi:6-pyruvoyltetrahydropterin/6-carboxytetrahydropterin synthase